ncbi:MAG: metallophosphoesterase [Acidobacteria bacterium]|nr:MAG: metallophosphoesterase [Acidobacteriota bacterium]REK03988.1 MAG: metallophosphoesterase [Acidobacteriota bacterium]REK15150.1 MAG: metallophosphoesterase [Acidobacteriota bacterium]REK46240.1 MAG: metallophosphoesterase [Acidobacteriota bacterium]
MKILGTQRTKTPNIRKLATGSETSLKELANNLSKTALKRSAFDKYNEATSLEVEEVTIELEKLPKKLDGFRLVHLSDIHHSPQTDLTHIEKAVEIANDLEPDLFLLTGDYVSHETEYVDPVAEVLGELESEHGTYACLGNHDHWTDPDLITEKLEAQGISVLVNSGFRFNSNGVSFWLCGVDDHMVKRTDLKAALHGSYPDEMKMLLAHNPVIIRQAARLGVDVMFSGHTHGGQIKIRENDKERKPLGRRRLSSGLHRRKDTQIYITRGIGTVVLPVRYQCPPEISFVTLRSV